MDWPAQVMNCGHEACEENIYRIKVKKGKSYYVCRKCRKIRDRERYNRRRAFRFELHCKCGCVTKASVPQETLGEHQGYSVRGMTLHCGTCGYSAYVKELTESNSVLQLAYKQETTTEQKARS